METDQLKYAPPDPNREGRGNAGGGAPLGAATTLAQTKFEEAMKLQAKPRKFYVVWRPTADAPQKRHDDHDSALEEAKRVAQKHRGDAVYVLVALAECVCDDIHVTRLV